MLSDLLQVGRCSPWQEEEGDAAAARVRVKFGSLAKMLGECNAGFHHPFHVSAGMHEDPACS